ncbi:STAS domain-containing protein [Halalkalibacter akibai]|uniref:Anti-sigma factor antagonist n=1 Tax=Halalkalibacter akibai (strain ATCC 43226 / DSM 21942 / CIP 109018 / JCM 9157 / 1139) TaxID=1236973 RepID=W4QZ17_HALA3|nr:STAS domain-containing protein [Halalkalibacter akibai]GAE36903.1 anti-sigma F factor antagonist [Halalkalibacter akibai JCM 9157]
MNLLVRKEQLDHTTILYLSGEIDAYTAPKLREELTPLTELGNSVKVDLSDVHYIDSTGLGIFIGALKATHIHKGDFILTGMSERIKRLFTITGLNEVITIEEGETTK